MEKVITEDGEFFREKLPSSDHPYFLRGDTTFAGMSYSKYRWVGRDYLANSFTCDLNAPFLNFISEKYSSNNILGAVKGYLWQDAAKLSGVVQLSSPIYVHFTSIVISEPSHEFEVYFLVEDESEYEQWLISKGLPVLTDNSGMHHYLHNLKINKLTKEIISNKRYYREFPFASHMESYKTIDGHVVRRGY
jgi:hypothetical protein